MTDPEKLLPCPYWNNETTNCNRAYYTVQQALADLTGGKLGAQDPYRPQPPAPQDDAIWTDAILVEQRGLKVAAPQDDLVEAVARSILGSAWVGPPPEGTFHGLIFHEIQKYMEAARAVIPIAQAPIIAERDAVYATGWRAAADFVREQDGHGEWSAVAEALLRELKIRGKTP